MHIQLEAISKTFHADAANEIKALRKIDISIKKKEFLCLVGANGSGKTTLLNIIAGIETPTTGKVIIDGQEVTHIPDYKRTKWLARVFQNPLSGTSPELSILDNFRLAAIRSHKKTWSIGINDAFRKKVQDKIALLGMALEDKIMQPMGTLSGGQRQALTLIMSVMDETKLLLLDEPTAALDPKSANIVLSTAQKIIDEYQLTAILITHNLKDAQQYGNRIIQMANGNIIQDIAEQQKKLLTVTDLQNWFV